MSMNESQISIFEIMQEDNYEKLYNQLEDYKIDEYYDIHFKGKSELLRVISDELEKLPRYREYRLKLFKLLKEFFRENDDVEIKYIKDYDYIRIYDLTGSYPVYCLSMINKDNFK